MTHSAPCLDFVSSDSVSDSIHQPVMPEEVVEALRPQLGGIVVDGTLGGGGHTRLLLESVGDAGTVISLDRDPRVIESHAGHGAKCVQANFCDLPAVLDTLEVSRVDGIVLDLGLSSDQLSDERRGFSYSVAGELDMRFCPDEGEQAWRLLETLPERELADLIYEFGEERFSRRIARRIVESRRRQPIRTADALAQLVRGCVPRSRGHRIDPATRTFQALRIAVNDEMGSLDRALVRFPDCLREQGRCVIISFHSLEDRRVKLAFRDDERWERVTKKPLRPTDEEQRQNPRSRSAKLRVAQKVSLGV